MYKIIQKSKLWLSISVAMFVLSLIALLVWGLKPGIDFTGGSLMEVQFNERPDAEQVRVVLADLKIDGGAIVQPTGTQNMLIRFKSTEESTHQSVLKTLKEKYKDNVTENRFDSIGALVGSELKTKAIYSVILVNIAIILYIGWAFRKVTHPVASWKYGLIAVIALIHDVTITAGVFAVLGHFINVEVDLPFIAALLTILGYSVHDTIVIFDRTRENLNRLGRMEFGDLVNRSLNETLARSINTTVATLLSLFAVYFFGGASIKYFALTLIVGITLGAYSSLFVASPLLVVFERWKKN